MEQSEKKFDELFRDKFYLERIDLSDHIRGDFIWYQSQWLKSTYMLKIARRGLIGDTNSNCDITM